MNKLMTAVAASVCAASLSAFAVAAEEKAAEKTEATQASEPAELNEEEEKVLEAGFDFDFLSAYIWRNAIQNDEMVMQPCVWADLTYFDPFWVGFSIWQNYDLTDRRHGIYEKGLTETDYNVHVGATAWQNEDEDISLDLELGHEWYDNQFVRDGEGNGMPDSNEIYVKATFNNPIVSVYGQVSWMYEDYGDFKQGVYYELGFKKEVEVYDSVTLGADWCLSFADGHYLNYIYGIGTRSGRGEDGEYEYEGSSGGFGSTTVKAYLTWQVTEWFSLGGVIAYTGVLNGAYRESLGDCGDDYWEGGGSYQRDFVWGGLQAKLSF